MRAGVLALVVLFACDGAAPVSVRNDALTARDTVVLRGDDGPIGDAGTVGASGAPGSTGFTGATGPQGNPGGTVGATGPMGARGVTGDAGATGPIGATGPRGATGPASAVDTLGVLACAQGEVVTSTGSGYTCSFGTTPLINLDSSLANAQLTLEEPQLDYARLTFANSWTPYWTVAGVVNALGPSFSYLNFYYSETGDVMSVRGDNRVIINGALQVQTFVRSQRISALDFNAQAPWPHYVPTWRATGAGQTVHAVAHLPHGAVLIDVACAFSDNDGDTTGMAFSVIRLVDGASTTCQTTARTTNSPNRQTLIADVKASGACTAIADRTVNNDVADPLFNTFLIEVDSDNGTESPNLSDMPKLFGCSVAYEMAGF